MTTATATESAARRRRLLGRGASLGLAGLLPLALDDSASGTAWRGAPGGIDGARVPPTTVSLADFGGAPGAGAVRIVKAFKQALAALARTNGGTLLVPVGVYGFGCHAQASTIILCRNLRDIAISAYGALFKATTTANVMPTLFYFFNFRNVTIAGASFTDPRHRRAFRRPRHRQSVAQPRTRRHLPRLQPGAQAWRHPCRPRLAGARDRGLARLSSNQTLLSCDY